MGEVEEICRQSGLLVDEINRAMHSKKLTEIPLELPNDIHLAEDETVIAKDHGVVILEVSSGGHHIYDGIIFLTNYRVIAVENSRAEHPIPLEFPLYSSPLRVVRVKFESDGIFGKKVHTLGFTCSSTSERYTLARYLLCILLKNQDPRLWESEIIKHKQSSLEQLKKKIKNLEEFFKTQSEKMSPTPQNFLLDPDEEIKLRAKACLPEVEEYFPMESALWDFINGRQNVFFDVYLTNKRLILPSIIGIRDINFYHRALEYNPDIRMESDMEIPLERVRMVSVKKYPETNFSLLKIDVWSFIAEFVLLNAERWKEEILNLRATRVLERERRIVIDFSFIREYLDKGGIILQTIKCPNCGAPISLPKSGDAIQCLHCGATIYAQNVFEKIKQMFSER